MKVALCLHGLASGHNRKSLSIDWKLGYKHYQKYILLPNKSVDIFLHTPNLDQQKAICEEYKPKLAKFETEKTTRKTARNKSICNRWYSLRQSVLLKQEFEHKNNFIYDWVMLGRFDIAWQTKVIFSNFNPNFFYIPYWEQAYTKEDRIINPNDYYKGGYHLNIQTKHKLHGWNGNNQAKAICDHWFFSSSGLIDKFSNIYDRLENQPVGEYLSSHVLAFEQLKRMNILHLVKFAFHRHDDFPLVRHIYFDGEKYETK